MSIKVPPDIVRVSVLLLATAEPPASAVIVLNIGCAEPLSVLPKVVVIVFPDDVVVAVIPPPFTKSRFLLAPKLVLSIVGGVFVALDNTNEPSASH